MKRNLFLSLILLPLPLAAEAVSGHFSSHNGGVTALPNEKTSSLTLSGSQSYSDCVANGQGGVFAVLAESTLTLHTESGDSIVFTDNRDCAAPSPSGVGFRGVPNDIYLGAGAALVLETAADSDIILNSGITADFDSSIIKSGEGTWALAGTAEAARVHGNVFVTEGTLALGEGCVFGSSMGTLSIGGKVTAAEGAAFGFGIVVLEEGGNITAEQPLNLMPGQTLDVYGGSISGTLSTYRDSTLELLGGSCTLDGDLKLGGGTIVFSGGSLSVTGNVISLSDTILELMPQPWVYEIGGNYTLLSCESGLKEGEVSLTVPSDSRTQYRTEIAGNSLVLHVSGEEAAELTWQGGKNMVWTTAPDMQAWQGEKGEAEAFYTYDRVNFTNAGKVTIAGNVTPHGICVENEKALTFSVDKKLGGGISGQTMLSKSGSGTLTLNDGNSYTDTTYLLEGTLKATGSTSFGTGEIRVRGGTLDLGGKEIANALSLEDDAVVKGGTKYTGALFISASLLKGSAISLAQTATLAGGTIDGVLSGTAGTDISGDVFFNTKQTYKGSTTVQAGGHLTLGTMGSVSGNISLLGGVLTLKSPKGLTLAKNTTLQLNGGSVNGLVTIGEGSTLVWHGGDMKTAPALKGGTLDLGAENSLTLTGTKALVQFGDKVVDLPGKGVVYTDETLTVNGGTVTINTVAGYEGELVVNEGTLKLSTGKVPTANAIVVSGNAAVVNGATHSGDITVDGVLAKGTTIKLLTGDQRVTLNGSGVMLGSISGAGVVDVRGDVDITGAKLTNANILLGGTLTHAKGLTLVKGQTLTLDGGSVNGMLTIGAGSVLDMNGHTLASAPVLKGGTYDDGGSNTLTLTGAKADISLGGQQVSLLSKSFIRSDAALTVNSGTVTVNDFGASNQEVTVTGGTLKLATGKLTSRNAIVVNGTAAVVNGATHEGDIEVNGQLDKGTTIKLLTATQRVSLNGEGALLGTIAGTGIVDVNASIDATAARITATRLNLNSGLYTNTKGLAVAKGQTLTLAGAALNLGPKGTLTTAVGSTLVVSSATTLTGNLTFGGGELVFADGTLDVSGTLTLSKPMTVTDGGVITYGTLKPFRGDIAALFGGADVELDEESCTITFNGGVAVRSRLAPAPLDTTAAPVTAETAEEATHAPAPLDTTPALPPAPVTNPVADAMVQADWGILDANRAFAGAVNSRHQHAALLDKGRGAAWVSAFGSAVRHGNKGAHHGSDGNIEGAVFGLEHAVSESGSIGLAVARSKNRISATGVTHLRQETAHVALYGQKHLAHGFTAEAAAAYGDTETKLGAASWQQKSAALTARLTHAQQVPDATALAFRTFGGLAYEATDAGSIGSAHTGSVQNLRAELGAGITHTAGKAHLYAEASLTGDLIRHNPTADLDGFRTHGADPGRIGLRATVGGLYEFTDTWSGTASYGIETESRSTAHTLNIGVSKSF